METSLQTGSVQIFSCCPKKLSCPKFGGAAAPLTPPAHTPMPIRPWTTPNRPCGSMSLLWFVTPSVLMVKDNYIVCLRIVQDEKFL